MLLYNHGEYGLPQHQYDAMELWEQAGELGLSEAYHNVGVAYTSWQFVERDMEKAKYYFELAAMGGDAKSRHNLGVFERNASNTSRAVKHWMISAGAGDDNLYLKYETALCMGMQPKMILRRLCVLIRMLKMR